MIPPQIRDILYIVAAVLFIFDLKWMAHPRTAVRGNAVGALAMGLAVVVTLLSAPMSWPYILGGVAVGGAIGALAALRVKMTSMPELVGLFNGFGGAASVLVAGSALVAAVAAVATGNPLTADETNLQMKVATAASALIGSVTFFGSYVAFGKLAEFLAVKWKLTTGQKIIKYGFSAVVVAAGVWYGIVAGIRPHGAGSTDGMLAIVVMLCGIVIGLVLLSKSGRFPGMDALKWTTALLSVIAGVWYGVVAGIQPHGAGSKDGLLAIVVLLCGVVIGVVLLTKSGRFPGMDALKWTTALLSVIAAVAVVMNPEDLVLFWVLVSLSGVLGVLLTLSIGGADMPVVIALLNSYSGIAAAATGFVMNNTVLIISGSLVGASGIVLTQIMCKAMNRSLANVLFGTMGPTGDTPDADEVYKSIKSTSAEEVAMVLEGVQRVVIVPGYGMAVAQAQHAVRSLANLLEQNGAAVDFAIHPVAGRMPGHMNVLLAEANVDYDKLREMDEINPELDQYDVAIVLGANDVVNPVARTDPKSPIAGMPIIDVDKANTVIVIKRSLSPGFAGIPNPLFSMDNTLMFFSDGRKAIQDIIAAVKEAA